MTVVTLQLHTLGNVVKKKGSPRRNAHRAGNRWRAECQPKVRKLRGFSAGLRSAGEAKPFVPLGNGWSVVRSITVNWTDVVQARIQAVGVVEPRLVFLWFLSR
jgi:hypothetical protein